MADQNNNPWQVVSETPAQQPSAQPAAAQNSQWQIANEAPQQPLTEQQRYQAATDEGSLWRKVLGMNPDGATLAKHGFTSDTYNQAEAKYREVSPGELARGGVTGFDPATQKIYNAGDHRPIIRGSEKAFTETLSGTSQL